MYNIDRKKYTQKYTIKKSVLIIIYYCFTAFPSLQRPHRSEHVYRHFAELDLQITIIVIDSRIVITLLMIALRHICTIFLLLIIRIMSIRL